MKIAERREGSAVVLELEGRLDHEGAGKFEEVTNRLIAAGEKAIIVDFRGVDFLASMGIRALIRPYQQLAPAGGKLVVANLGESVLAVFRVAGIDQAVPIYDTVDAAVKAEF